MKNGFVVYYESGMYEDWNKTNYCITLVQDDAAKIVSEMNERVKRLRDLKSRAEAEFDEEEPLFKQPYPHMSHPDSCGFSNKKAREEYITEYEHVGEENKKYEKKWGKQQKSWEKRKEKFMLNELKKLGASEEDIKFIIEYDDCDSLNNYFDLDAEFNFEELELMEL